MFGCCTECIKLIVGLCGVCWISVVHIFVGHLPAEQPFHQRSQPASTVRFLFTDGRLAGVLIHPKGVNGQGIKTELALCNDCLGCLHRGRVPDLALSNHLFLGEVPPELQDLAVVEESMIALCRAKCCIVHLKANGKEYASHSAQCGAKGNLIIYP